MKIVQLEPIGLKQSRLERVKADFKEQGHDYIYHTDRAQTTEEIIARAHDAEVLVISNMLLTKEILLASPKLKMISVAFAGVDHVDMETCNARNIIVSNGGEYSRHAVAELTLGMAIQLLRKFDWHQQQVRNGKTREGFLGTELHGKTYGIIGTGSIGGRVAELAHAFGCKITAYNRSKIDAAYIHYKSLDEVLKTSDIVSIHLPLTEETRHLIGPRELSLMKPEAILINTARGPLCDYQALAQQLKDKKLGGAAIDVYETEPPLPADHPLFSTPNTFLLPHIGYATNQAIEKRGEIVMENIHSWLKGKPQNLMNTF
ncbi:MAG: NAD(P)-dependent oxidoreductase [Bacteroidales bacterium]